MDEMHARTVFFVEDAERSLAFYTKSLGFSLDWNYEEQGRAFVFQVSLRGLTLILNQAEDWTAARPGHGRLFVGLDERMFAALRQHIEERAIEATVTHWGAPTLVIRDLDGNELFFWVPESERPRLEAEIEKQRAGAAQTRAESAFAEAPTNRSMPAATVIPVLEYPDVPAAAAWLCRVFGFSERLRIGTHRAQLDVGSGAVVVATAGESAAPSAHSVMVRVRSVDEHFRRASAAGAVVLAAPQTYPYGERQYNVKDLAGHVWTFSQTLGDVAPESWGGELVSSVR
jgi:uncharacterized glyoxalase superfamily protein PhnB